MNRQPARVSGDKSEGRVPPVFRTDPGRGREGRPAAEAGAPLKQDECEDVEAQPESERKPCPKYLDVWRVGDEWLKVPAGAVCPRCGFLKSEHP